MLSPRGQPTPLPDPAVFTVTPTIGASGPFVFASPHSGEWIPADMTPDPNLSSAQVNSAADAHMHDMAASGPEHGAPLIAARLTRAYVDLNRAPDALDPALIEGVMETAGPHATAGYGVLHRLSGEGALLYARRLTLDEAQARIARVHAPYHAALARLMHAAHDRHGRATLIDWHSMPGRTGGVEVVLGDRHGTSCGAALTRRLRTLFEREGLTVALNRPYAGGWSTQAWGRPGEAYEAIQIEISRALYLDPASGAPSAGYGRCRALMGRVIAALLDRG